VSEIVSTRILDSFIARQDYTGAVSKTGTAAQIEIMYRDMNSMVDTLGLNSRSLASFIKFHQQRLEVTRNDLEEVNDEGEEGPWYEKWSIGAAEDLGNLVDQLEKELDASRVQDYYAKMAEFERLVGDVSKLQTKLNNIRRELINRKDPERMENLRKASLPKELADQQKVVRQEYAQLLSLLSKAEEATFLLKSKLSGLSAANGKPTAVPTVDAVKKTISRLIQMTEKKNNDILLLESQLRKLNVSVSASGSRPSSSSSRTLGTLSRSSRALVRTAQSPLTTPRRKLSLAELNRTVQTPEQDDTPSKGYGLYYTPEGSPTQSGCQTIAALGSLVQHGDMSGLREANSRRKEVAKKLMDAVGKRGVKVTKITQ
jgi:nucleoporin NUP159